MTGPLKEESALETAGKWWQELDADSRSLKALERHLRETTPRETLVDLWHTTSQVQAGEGLAGTWLALFQASVLLLGSARQLDALGRLFSIRFADRIGIHLAIEFFLARLTEPPLDGLRPLFQAWEETADPLIKRAVASVLARAEIPADVDPEHELFIPICRRWCEANRKEARLNLDYAHKLSRRSAVAVPLFIHPGGKS